MAESEAPDNLRDWESMNLEALVGAQRQKFQAINSHVQDLLEIAPILQRRLRDETGLVAQTDFGVLAQSLEKLVQSSEVKATNRRPPAAARPARAGRAGKPLRYQLVYRDSGDPVRDEKGQPVAFKTRIQILRGPRYEALLGKDGVKNVQLLDSESGAVVSEHLRLGPAPGGRK